MAAKDEVQPCAVRGCSTEWFYATTLTVGQAVIPVQLCGAHRDYVEEYLSGK